MMLDGAMAFHSLRDLCTGVDDEGILPYAWIYRHASADHRLVIVACFCLWLMVLFASMAITAKDFLSVHLEAIVDTLGIDQNLAGLTIFAFGNGSSDLFSTIAAMGVGQGTLAISELFGAATFITSVVFGLIAVTKPFSVDARLFAGELIWFILAVIVLTISLADGRLSAFECICIIMVYIVFICYAMLRPLVSSEQNEVMRVVHVQADGRTVRDQDVLDESTTLFSGHIDEHYGTFAAQQTCHVGISIERSTWGPSRSHLAACLQEIWPSIRRWQELGGGEKALTVFSAPILMIVALTIPAEPPLRAGTDALSAIPISDTAQNLPADLGFTSGEGNGNDHTGDSPQEMKLRIACLQLMFGPQLLVYLVLLQVLPPGPTIKQTWPILLITLMLSISSVTLLLAAKRSTGSGIRGFGDLVVSIYAFFASATWIYLIAESIVAVLTLLGCISRISPVILGATIFAVGNSSNDLFANIAVAERGAPRLAASACFGGPMMNMLVGIGGGALLQIFKQNAGGYSWEHEYSFEVSRGFYIGAAALIVVLTANLLLTWWKSWHIDRYTGWCLVSLWTAFSIGNIVVSSL